MKILQRYVFFSVLFTSIATVATFVFVLMAGKILKEILSIWASGQLPGSLVIELIYLLVPYLISYALPFGILSGILIVLGRLSSQHEIVAIKSIGLSIWYVAFPILVLSILAVIFSIFINCFYAPIAKTSYKNMLVDVVRQNPLNFITSKVFINEFPGYVLYVGEKEGENMEDFWVWELDESHRAVRLLRAQSGSFKYHGESDSLLLKLNHGYAELRDKNNPENLQEIRPSVSFSETTIRLPLEQILGKRSKYSSISGLSLPQLLERIEILKRNIEELNNNNKTSDLSVLMKDKMQLQFEVQKNIAMAVSILSLAIIGIPLGIKVGRKETYANFALALSLALTYYFLIIIVGWFVDKPELRADLLVWLPNLVFLSVGCWFLRKANKN